MKSIDRRGFLKSSGSAVAAMSAASYSRVKGANDRLAVGVVGLRGRGKSHIAAFLNNPGAEVTALCDIDQAVLERATAATRKEQNRKPDEYADIRKMLDDKSIDAVSIATPNHWHALMTIWACQAGKDVYVEKPASHNIFEGRKMIEAARKYKRMVQVGDAEPDDDPQDQSRRVATGTASSVISTRPRACATNAVSRSAA